MNPVEIEEAVSALAEQPFDPAEFPFAFLKAFDNKDTTIRKLRAGASNSSDIGGVLQRNHIHIAVAPVGEVSKTLAALRASPATAKAKARFILATDGVDFEAENLVSSDAPVACAYNDFPKMSREATDDPWIPEEFGGLYICLDIGSFVPRDGFMMSVANMAAGIRASLPAEGFAAAELPGDRAASRARERRASGVIDVADATVSSLRVYANKGGG